MSFDANWRKWLLLTLLGGSAAAATPPPGQGPLVDAGTLIVTREGTVIGREDFSIRRGRPGQPDGFTIRSSVAYPPTDPRVTLAPILELGPDSLPNLLQFDVLGDGQRRLYARFGPRRATVRIVHPGGESARELPVMGRTLAAGDSVFAFYALFPRAAGSLQVITFQSARRGGATVTDQGVQPTTIQGARQELREIVLRVAEEDRRCWYDGDGRLMKVEIPSLGLIAERAAGQP